MRLSGARTVACVWSYTGRAQKYPVRPSASTVTRMATNAMTPLRRRGGAGAAELTIVAGTSVRERSPAAPGNGRPATAAAIRAGGPETARAGGPEVTRGSPAAGSWAAAWRGMSGPAGGGAGTGAVGTGAAGAGTGVAARPSGGRYVPGTGAGAVAGGSSSVTTGSTEVASVSSGGGSKSGLALDTTDR